MRTDSLHLEQAPPLWVPVAFYVTAPLAILAGGALLIVDGPAALAGGWAPATLAIVHLATLGFLGTVMTGSLYQMTPVVLGAPVRAVRLAWLVLPLLQLGTAGLAAGLYTGTPALVAGARVALSLALALFLVPVGAAALRGEGEVETRRGLQLALLCLALAGALGVTMASGHAGGAFPGARDLWTRAHLGLALLGWVGGLLTAVSWQVLPMFYLASPVPAPGRRVVVGGLALGALATPVLLASFGNGAAVALAPAAIVAWIVHPALAARSLRAARRRPDPSRRGWAAGLAVGPFVAAAALAAEVSTDPRWGVLWGWLALWGWAGLVVHAMLGRIVPFLVWFHRWSHRVGLVKTPAMRELLPDRLATLGLGVHGASVVVGAVAIVAGAPALVRLTGGLVVLTGLLLLVELGSALRPREAGPLAVRGGKR